MFVTVLSFRARAGEEDAIVALHEDWQASVGRDPARGFVSGELLSDPEDPRAFVAISRFIDESAARTEMAHPEHLAWFRRLASLSETEPRQRYLYAAWQASPPAGELPVGERKTV